VKIGELHIAFDPKRFRLQSCCAACAMFRQNRTKSATVRAWADRQTEMTDRDVHRWPYKLSLAMSMIQVHVEDSQAQNVALMTAVKL